MSYPTDPYVALQYNMANTYDAYKLAYKSILLHLNKLPLDDLVNFLGYCRAWADHDLYHESLADRSKFEGAKLKEMMEKLAGPLFEHLDEEVEHLAPDNLKVYTTEELGKQPS
ncbi:hypothetical protein C8R43DRAFT_1169283 [Mycena crocata]|nr:hypothetical protein C8R43DRAFT_1169283 [Mycena crocata]